MKIKWILTLFSIFCILFLTLGIASATDDNSTLENFSSEHAVDEKTFEAIQDTVDNAGESDTIILDGNYSSSKIPVNVNKPVTIKGTGNGAKLDGNSKYGIFNIDSDNVILENIIFANGYADSGGAIYADSHNLRIINCTFVNNNARLYDGAIFSAGDNVSIENCQFTGNLAQYTGGAIQIEGNDNYVNACNFEDNIGGHVGAAVAWVGLNGFLTDCQFTNSKINTNTASQFGGAVVWMGDNGKLTRSYFYQNQAKKFGAAVYWKGNNGSLNYCIFENNTSNNDRAYWGDPSYANDNYWGFNINSLDEFVSSKLVYYNDSYNAPQNWVNIKKTASSVSFKSNDGSLLTESLPDYEVDFLSSKVIVHNNSYALKSTSISVSKIVTYSLYAGKYLKIVLKDGNGKKLASKYVKIKLNGVTYNRKTDSNGAVKFKISLKKSGTYVAKISFKGNAVYKASSKDVKVTVKKQKPTLTLKTKSLKLKTKKKIVKIALKDQFKKALSKKTVKLTINKKTYTAKTNSKGIASFKVTLKSKKTYKFTAKFKGNSYYKTVSKNGKIRVK